MGRCAALGNGRCGRGLEAEALDGRLGQVAAAAAFQEDHQRLPVLIAELEARHDRRRRIDARIDDVSPQVVELALLAHLAQIRSQRAGRESVDAMAAVATGLEKQIAPAGHQRRARKAFFGVALCAVGLHELLAAQMGGGVLAPSSLHGIAEHGVGPEGIFAVRVGRFQAATLPVVARGAAEVGELVPPLPASVAEHVAHLHRVGVSAQRLLCRGEARIVDRDVTALAAIDARFAEPVHDGLLDLGNAPLKRGALGGSPGLFERLIEISLLVGFPSAVELVINDHSGPDQHHQAHHG